MPPFLPRFIIIRVCDCQLSFHGKILLAFPSGGKIAPVRGKLRESKKSHLINLMDSGVSAYQDALVCGVINFLLFKYFANKGPSSQGYGFSSCHVWM